MKFVIEIFKSFSPNIKRLILIPRITNNYRRCNDMPMKIKRGVCAVGQVTS
jgi:hypothetical protein